jgi:hypothetical protein
MRIIDAFFEQRLKFDQMVVRYEQHLQHLACAVDLRR